MDRQCEICQSVTNDDELTVCSVCGAELPQAGFPADESTEDVTEVLDLDNMNLEDVPDTEPQTDDSVHSDDWDTGAVGGEAGVDIEVGDNESSDAPGEESEEIVLAENEFLCPSCKNTVAKGTKACPNCGTSTEFLVSCDVCGMGIDKLADICPHCYTDLNIYRASAQEEDTKEEEEIQAAEPPEEETEPIEPELQETSDADAVPDEKPSVEAAELGKNGNLSEKKKKAMLKKLLKEQKDLEKKLKKGQITEEEFAKRLDEIRMGNGFGPIGGYVLDEAEGKDLETVEMGQNGKLSEKDKKIMLKKLKKEQRNLEKQLRSGEITEDEFGRRLDKVRMGNGFGPIGGYVLDEAEVKDEKRIEREARNELIREELAKERKTGIFSYYTLSLITLFFFVFLAIFVLMEFIFTISNFTTQADVPNVIFFNFTPTLDEITSVPVLLFGVIVTMVDLVLHLWDRKINLGLSMVPTWIMIISLGIDATHFRTFVGIDLILILALLGLLIFM
ncbi:MAG: hypothetical protein KKD98_06825, partial [Candidatus Thermoplasmatota archaeon]|nr:hypothetical protein [Candidatus Thermoplasmatota archaeon]